MGFSGGKFATCYCQFRTLLQCIIVPKGSGIFVSPGTSSIVRCRYYFTVIGGGIGMSIISFMV